MLQFTSEQLERYTGLLEEADKAFVGKVQRDAVAQAQADIFFQLGIRDKSLMKWGLDSIAATKGAYSTAMMDVVSKYQAGTYDSAKAFSRWRGATKRAMEATYRGGAASVGNPFYKDLKIPMRDQRLMARYLNKEGGFFKGLMRDIKDPKFRPASQIPRDAKGKMLPGYRTQRFSFQQRAGMYPDSMKAMRYNGALMGAGNNVEIRWVLGVPMTKHCPDCPQLAARVWTPATLPTVPGAGDTQCIYRCYCSLEIRQKASGRTLDLAGRATEGAIRAAGKNARVYDSRGNEIGGVLQADIEVWTAEMNRARQMMSITTGDIRMDWIMRRKQLNRLIIDRAKIGGYRVVPTTSVSALVKTVKAVAAKGGGLVDDFAALKVGDEVWLVRGDYSSFGVMGMRNGQLVFKSPTGVVLDPYARTDIMFIAKAPTIDFHSNISSVEKTIFRGWSSSDYEEARQFLALSPMERGNAMSRVAPGSTRAIQYERALEVEKMFLKYKDGQASKNLYRGLEYLDADTYSEMKRYYKGQKMKIDKTITSWSSEKRIADHFSKDGEYVVKFTLEKNRTLTKELDISQYSAFRSEAEVIVADTEFIVVSVKETIVHVEKEAFTRSLWETRKELTIVLREIK